MERAERRSLLSPALLAAIETIERAVSPMPAERAEFDQTLVMLKQQRRLAQEALDRAKLLTHQTKMVELGCLAAFEELKVRVELREEQLGIEKEESSDS